jgi:hypothetical protein
MAKDSCAIRPPVDQGVTGRTGTARAIPFVVSALLAFAAPVPAEAAGDNAVLQWARVAISMIREMQPPPPVAARSLAIVHTCMFDAWAAYDATAVGTRLGGEFRRPAAERTGENKRAAVSHAAKLCLEDLYPTQADQFAGVLRSQGLDPQATRIADPATPAGVAAAAAAAVLEFRHEDGSNQKGDLKPGTYSDWTGYVASNTAQQVSDLDRWQPLPTMDTYGQLGAQSFQVPHWGRVTPFAIGSGDRFRPPPPVSARFDPKGFAQQARELVELSAGLTDEQKMIVEYWADGPQSEYPPGHWCLIAEYVSMRDGHDLDADVKMFFALSNALMDAGIAAWDAKRFYDYVRPITAIRQLESGRAIQTWGGPGKGTVSLAGHRWIPYQPVMAMTPPFPEYVSGHSTFSMAAAEILRRFTGSDRLDMKVEFAPGSSKVEPGRTPRQPLSLSLATFTGAAEQAGLSRRLGGIHFRDADMAGRELGRRVAQAVWMKALASFGQGV